MRRVARVRARVRGTAERPRLCVLRSNRSISAQLIDDSCGVTLVAVSSRDVRAGKRQETKVAEARAVGRALAERARNYGIVAATFDRRWYRYHGRVKALAEGAREGGLVL